MGKVRTYALTQQKLMEFCTYNPETGDFIANHKAKSGNRKKGAVLGFAAKGYRMIGMYNNHFYSHRLAWMYMHEYMPKKPLKIIHIDGDKTNNAIKNLKTELPENHLPNPKASTNITSVREGVYYSKNRNKWAAGIMVNGIQKNLGLFQTKKEAIKARKKAEQDLDYYKVGYAGAYNHKE